MKKITKDKEKLLKQYWIDNCLEMMTPYEDIPIEWKIRECKTLHFRKYVLNKIWQELKKVITDTIRKYL